MNHSFSSVVTAARRRLRGAFRGQLDEQRLRDAGVHLGGKVIIEAGVWVDLEWGWLIELGDLVVLSPRVMIFAHDAATRRALGYTRVAPVSIGARTYLGAGTIVLPGVTVGEDTIVGAGSIVSRDLPPASLAVGAPARPLCPASEALARNQAAIDAGLVLGDVRVEWARPDWSVQREKLRARVLEAGEAWVT
jgi:maltose O-acetyltransferase